MNKTLNWRITSWATWKLGLAKLSLLYCFNMKLEQSGMMTSVLRLCRLRYERYMYVYVQVLRIYRIMYIVLLGMDCYYGLFYP